MPTTGLHGPHPLTRDAINTNVTRTSAGAYALGKTKDGTFLVSRVGRADKDLAKRLGDYIGQYAQFKYGYLGSPKAAFEKECGLYHDFSPPGNSYHPDRPDDTNWACPFCAVFDD